MASASAACGCGCCDAAGFAAHRIMAALADDDLDTAIAAGLLENAACDSCRPECRAGLLVARANRLAALAARERFRAREARLSRRQQERLLRREAAVAASPTTASSLPPAAAAALARARAKAAGSTRE
jgi:hypothetical protein